MILKVQNMQSGEIENVSVMGGSDISPDNSRLVSVDMSDEDCLFGQYLDDGYWITAFENEGLDGVQKQLRTLQELPDKIEGLCDPIEDVFKESGLNESEFVDAVQSNCIWHNELADDPGAYAEEDCAETDAQIINEYPYNQFFDFEKFGEWLLQSEINQGLLFEVNGNYYEIN